MSSIAVLRPHPSWRDDAACMGCPTEEFFPDPDGDMGIGVLARCRGCPVRDECRIDALVDLASDLDGADQPGVRGGLTPTEVTDPIRLRRFLRDEALPRLVLNGLHPAEIVAILGKVASRASVYRWLKAVA